MEVETQPDDCSENPPSVKEPVIDQAVVDQSTEAITNSLETPNENSVVLTNGIVNDHNYNIEQPISEKTVNSSSTCTPSDKSEKDSPVILEDSVGPTGKDTENGGSDEPNQNLPEEIDNLKQSLTSNGDEAVCLNSDDQIDAKTDSIVSENLVETVEGNKDIKFINTEKIPDLKVDKPKASDCENNKTDKVCPVAENAENNETGNKCVENCETKEDAAVNHSNETVKNIDTGESVTDDISSVNDSGEVVKETPEKETTKTADDTSISENIQDNLVSENIETTDNSSVEQEDKTSHVSLKGDIPTKSDESCPSILNDSVAPEEIENKLSIEEEKLDNENVDTVKDTLVSEKDHAFPSENGVKSEGKIAKSAEDCDISEISVDKENCETDHISVCDNINDSAPESTESLGTCKISNISDNKQRPVDESNDECPPIRDSDPKTDSKISDDKSPPIQDSDPKTDSKIGDDTCPPIQDSDSKTVSKISTTSELEQSGEIVNTDSDSPLGENKETKQICSQDCPEQNPDNTLGESSETNKECSKDCEGQSGTDVATTIDKNSPLFDTVEQEAPKEDCEDGKDIESELKGEVVIEKDKELNQVEEISKDTEVKHKLEDKELSEIVDGDKDCSSAGELKNSSQIGLESNQAEPEQTLPAPIQSNSEPVTVDINPVQTDIVQVVSEKEVATKAASSDMSVETRASESKAGGKVEEKLDSSEKNYSVVEMEVDQVVNGDSDEVVLLSPPKIASPVVVYKPVEQLRKRAKMSMSPNKGISASIAAAQISTAPKFTIKQHSARKSLNSASFLERGMRSRRKLSKDADTDASAREKTLDTVSEQIEVVGSPKHGELNEDANQNKFKTTINVDKEISFVIETGDEDAMNSSIEDIFPPGVDQPAAKRARMDLGVEVISIPEESASPAKSTTSQGLPSEPSSTKSTPSKGVPKARKSCHPLPKSGLRQDNHEKAKSQMRASNAASVAKMTLRLNEIEKSLGIKGKSLSQIDAKTLDKLILEKAQLGRKKLKWKSAKVKSELGSENKLSIETKKPSEPETSSAPKENSSIQAMPQLSPVISAKNEPQIEDFPIKQEVSDEATLVARPLKTGATKKEKSTDCDSA